MTASAASSVPTHTDPVRAPDFTHRRPERKSCFQWVPSDVEQLQETERQLLSGLVFEQRTIAGINTISSPRTSKSPLRKTVILLHGFGGGLGVWAQNWKHLSERYHVHAIDLPGFARSVRTPAPKMTDTETAMVWYEQRLEQWLTEAAGSALLSEDITLVGHSFGGYIAAQFVTKRLERHMLQQQRQQHPFVPIQHLVLADPWGVPPRSAEEEAKRPMPLRIRVALRLFYAFSPLAVLRAAGPWGPNFLPKVRPDFAGRWSNLPDPMIFYDYTYHCNALTPPTGEKAFKACCEGRGFAKEPLATIIPQRFDRLLSFTRSIHDPLERGVLMKMVPHTTIMYGEHTWMTKSAGFDMALAVRQLLHEANTSTTSSPTTRSPKVVCATVSDAGHQLNTDNVDEFNAKLVSAIEEQLDCCAVHFA